MGRDAEYIAHQIADRHRPEPGRASDREPSRPLDDLTLSWVEGRRARPIHLGAYQEIPMLDTPRIVHADAQPTAIIRLTIPRPEVLRR